MAARSRVAEFARDAVCGDAHELVGDRPNGNTFIVWAGASLLDGAPIMVVASLHSVNDKTGDAVQMSIIRSDMAPGEAIASGGDVSVCGSCLFRGVKGDGRTCYVLTFTFPRAQYSATMAGHAGAWDPKLARGRVVRIGAYGDPLAVPSDVWSWALSGAGDVLGYTHQWRLAGRVGVVDYPWCMASCDTPQDKIDARAFGYRLFTAVPDGVDYAPDRGEIECPAERTGRGVKCTQCRQCSGTSNGRTVDVFVRVHGAGAVNHPGRGAY